MSLKQAINRLQWDVDNTPHVKRIGVAKCDLIELLHDWKRMDGILREQHNAEMVSRETTDGWQPITSEAQHRKLFNAEYGSYLFQYSNGSISLASLANSKTPIRFFSILTPPKKD